MPPLLYTPIAGAGFEPQAYVQSVAELGRVVGLPFGPSRAGDATEDEPAQTQGVEPVLVWSCQEAVEDERQEMKQVHAYLKQAIRFTIHKAPGKNYKRPKQQKAIVAGRQNPTKAREESGRDAHVSLPGYLPLPARRLEAPPRSAHLASVSAAE